ncbi:hypothetical protein [Cronobacter sakazakii]|uniref:hypothetical protein n=1 Tax=Cronobacter sakazakii TaxID=28141 RepID=UPI001EFD13BF|nr:hypothetical protein [Cronobacter sakazakii]
MSWERKNAVVTELPPAPSLYRWLCTGVLSFIVGALLFVLHVSSRINVLSAINIWAVSFSPILAWLLIFFARYYLRLREVKQHLFLQKEAQYSQQQWTQWAERYVAILASAVMLPDHFSARDFGTERVQQYGLSRRLISPVGKKRDDISTLRLLIGAVENELRDVSAKLPLQITIVSDCPYDRLADDFFTVWHEYLTQPITPENLRITASLSFSAVEERLKKTELAAELILVLQLSGEENYSDGLAALLLASDDVACNCGMPYPARLLRPMQLDITRFDTELNVFLQTQTTACRTKKIIGDAKSWSDYFAALITGGNTFGATWKPEENELLEKWCGKPGPFSPWLLTALAADWVKLHNYPVLALFSHEQDYFISSLTPGSGDEDTR